jgi:hypothetical protein
MTNAGQAKARARVCFVPTLMLLGGAFLRHDDVVDRHDLRRDRGHACGH